MSSVRASLAAVLLAATLASPALAAGPTFADREAARTLSGKGYEAFEAAQYRKAIELFRQAEARFHAPPHLLYVARAQFKLGELIEAAATFQRIVDEKLPPDAPGPFKEAQANARAELGEVDVLIPSVSIALQGEVPKGTIVAVDGRPLDANALAHPVRLDPGVHVITAQPPGRPTIERRVSLKLGGGDDTHVVMPLTARTPGWVVGAVISFVSSGLGTGAGVTGAVLAPRSSGSRATALQALEIGGFALAGAGLVSGVVLVAVRPGADPTPIKLTAWSLRAGVGTLTIAGRF
jgi:hypothetical protein